MSTCCHELPAYATTADGNRVEHGTIGCGYPATVGPYCSEHGPKSDDSGAPYSVDVRGGWSDEYATFAGALARYTQAELAGEEPRLCGYYAEPSDDNGDGGTDGLTDDERELIEIADMQVAK